MRTYGDSDTHLLLDTSRSRVMGCYHMAHGEEVDSTGQVVDDLTTGVTVNTTIQTQ
jgi:hypothetical protein